mgnify:CR=1 FL=1
MTIFMDFLMFIVAVFLMTIVMSVDKINAWQEKKRIKKLPIKKMKLRCICKTTCYDDFVMGKSRIEFKIKNELYECKVPIELYDKLKKGKNFDAEFYVDHYYGSNFIKYVLKSINDIEIPSSDCKIYIED